MLALAVRGGLDGSWLRAMRQTGGRGRLGRKWESPIGNLYASTLVRLTESDPPARTLALVAANAVHASVAPLCSGQTRIKWPNDIMVDGAKIAGILLERAGDAVVVGIGVNVASHPDHLDRPVTSLVGQGASDVDAARLFGDLRKHFAHWLSIWRTRGTAPTITHWHANAYPIGSLLHIASPDGTSLSGSYNGLDSDGALILRLANGERRVIHAGDVHLL